METKYQLRDLVWIVKTKFTYINNCEKCGLGTAHNEKEIVRFMVSEINAFRSLFEKDRTTYRVRFLDEVTGQYIDSEPFSYYTDDQLFNSREEAEKSLTRKEGY